MIKEISMHFSNNFNYSWIKIIDTDFECEHTLSKKNVGCADIAFVIIEEYGKRNLPIVKNLFSLNLILMKHFNYKYEEVLLYESMDMRQDYPKVNFEETYYHQLKIMWEKYKAFM